MTYVKPIRQNYEAAYTNFTLQKSYFNRLISTTFTDESYATYDENATYNTGDFVIEPNTHSIYRSAKDSNTSPLDDETSWVNYGAANSFRMFDEVANTQSRFDTSATIEIESNWYDTVSFLNLKNVTTVQVVQTDLDTNTVMFDETYNLSDYGVQSLYEYWYKPVRFKGELFIAGLRFLGNAKLTITFNGSTEAYVGAVVTGMRQDLGCTLYGTSVRIKDYSIYKEDTFGNMTFERRPFARIINAKASIDNTMADYVFQAVADIRGEVSLFSADERDEGYTSLTTLGYIKEFEIPFENPVKSKIPITIVGVA